MNGAIDHDAADRIGLQDLVRITWAEKKWNRLAQSNAVQSRFVGICAEIDLFKKGGRF